MNECALQIDQNTDSDIRSGYDAMQYAAASVDLLDAEPYKIPERTDNYVGDFWKYLPRTNAKGARVFSCEADPTITESIQLRNAAPFLITDAQPTPVRYVLKGGEYFRSLNGADSLPPKTVLVRLRYADAEGAYIEGSKTWLARVGLYVMHDQMRKAQWRLIELVPVSYERSQPTDSENADFCRKRLCPHGRPDADAVRMTCWCGRKFIARRASRRFHSDTCRVKFMRRLKKASRTVTLSQNPC